MQIERIFPNYFCNKHYMYVIFDTLNAGKLIGLHVTFLNPFDALG